VESCTKYRKGCKFELLNVKSENFWLEESLFVQILLSVMSLVAEPNIHSPANVDAAKMWRDNRDEFFKIASIHVGKTLEEPPGMEDIEWHQS
jgi:ubiquitin-protein ligase